MMIKKTKGKICIIIGNANSFFCLPRAIRKHKNTCCLKVFEEIEKNNNKMKTEKCVAKESKGLQSNEKYQKKENTTKQTILKGTLLNKIPKKRRDDSAKSPRNKSKRNTDAKLKSKNTQTYARQFNQKNTNTDNSLQTKRNKPNNTTGTIHKHFREIES